MASSATSIITMRLEDTLIARIDESAKRAGLTRTKYIRQWLPDDCEPRITNGVHQPPEPPPTGEPGLPR
jgi:hypothetical protein